MARCRTAASRASVACWPLGLIVAVARTGPLPERAAAVIRLPLDFAAVTLGAVAVCAGAAPESAALASARADFTNAGGVVTRGRSTTGVVGVSGAAPTVMPTGTTPAD